MSTVQILIVEDEPAILELIAFTVKSVGWQPVLAETATDALHILSRIPPDLLVLDWMLPDESGIVFLKRLRTHQAHRNLPVIMLTARSGEDDKVTGLNEGADDYMVKPFSPKELIARMNALLRRKAPDKAQSELKLGDLTLNPETHKVYVQKTLIELGKTEFRLLRFFLSHPDRIVSRQQILDRIWPNQPDIEERTVDVHVLRLRKALGKAGNMVQTIRGVGYKLSDPLK